MGFEGDVRESGLKPSSAAGRAVGQAPKPFPGPLAADACTAALAAEAGPGTGVATLMGFEGDVWESGLKPSSGSRQGRWPGSKVLPGTFGCRCLHRSLGCRSRAGRGHVESCLLILSYFFLMGFEGDVRESGLKPSSAAGRAVGQAPKPFPVATLRAVSQFFLMGFEGDVRGPGLKPSSAAGRAVGQAPKPLPAPQCWLPKPGRAWPR